MRQLVQQSVQALGSYLTLSVVTSDVLYGEDLLCQMWERVFGFEERFSRFRSDSELVAFNRAAGTRIITSEPFLAVLRAAKNACESSAGLFNPFILPALERVGYATSWVAPEQAAPSGATHVADWQELEIGESWARIPVGCAIDLGGCGKGYLLDELSHFLVDKIPDYWLSLGGDILAAGVDVAGSPWRVDIEAGTDLHSVAHIQSTQEHRFAIATSGIVRRRGVKAGVPWHHLIDPRTLLPAQTDLATASVCAYSALSADVLASSAVIAGSHRAPDYLYERGITDTLLTRTNGEMILHGKMIRLDV